MNIIVIVSTKGCNMKSKNSNVEKVKNNDVKQFINKEKVDDREFELIADYCKIRYESNVSQRELAHNVGIAQSTVARIEKNLHSAQLSTFINILSYLGYHLEIKKD